MSNPRAIDLFCGAGGATVGLKKAGVEVIAGVENDSSAIRSFALNHPEVELFFADILKLDPHKVIDKISLRKGDLDILNACPPCQKFSSLYTQKNKSSKKEGVVIDALSKWVENILPKSIIVENVIGLRKDIYYRKLLQHIETLGYSWFEGKINVTDFGVPQRRKRLFMVAIHCNLEKELLQAVIQGEVVEVESAYNRIKNLGPIGKGKDQLHVARTPSPVVKKRLESIPSGGSRFDLPEELQLDCHKRLKTRAASSTYGRVPLDGPAPTMTTRCTTPSCGQFIHPVENRGLSLREAALLQDFPPTYRFWGNYGEIERQIGNAVPSSVVKSIANRILKIMKLESGGSV